MTYNDWFLKQGKLHKEIIKKLQGKNINEIIEYFSYDNMKKNEPEFCPLYKDNKKCHDIKNLNCYLCACPNFRFKDEGVKKQEGKTLYSYCNIESKNGSQYIGEDYIHQNCSGCVIPHKEKYIKRNFSKNWFKIMKDVRI